MPRALRKWRSSSTVVLLGNPGNVREPTPPRVRCMKARPSQATESLGIKFSTLLNSLQKNCWSLAQNCPQACRIEGRETCWGRCEQLGRFGREMRSRLFFLSCSAQWISALFTGSRIKRPSRPKIVRWTRATGGKRLPAWRASPCHRAYRNVYVGAGC